MDSQILHLQSSVEERLRRIGRHDSYLYVKPKKRRNNQKIKIIITLAILTALHHGVSCKRQFHPVSEALTNSGHGFTPHSSEGRLFVVDVIFRGDNIAVLPKGRINCSCC